MGRKNKHINDLIKEYRKRIEIFENIYSDNVTLPTGIIDRYVKAYRKQLEIVSILEPKQYEILFNHINNELEEIIEPKRFMGFDRDGSKNTQFEMMSLFIQNPPIQIERESVSVLATSIYIEDPWEQKQPRNDDELKIHYEWWEIEKWKHKACESLFEKITISTKKPLREILEKKGEDNRPEREKVIEEAIKIMKETKKDRSHFISEAKDARSTLYNPIYQKELYNDLSSIRYWLDNAIKAGEI